MHIANCHPTTLFATLITTEVLLATAADFISRAQSRRQCRRSHRSRHWSSAMWVTACGM